MLAFIGIYSVVGNPFDLFMVIFLGFMSWILRKLDFSLASIILGFVLGHLFKNNLRRALSISGGDWSILYNSRYSVAHYILTLFIVIVPIWLARRNKLRNQRQTEGKAA